jgi:glutamate carboxypeptidase
MVRETAALARVDSGTDDRAGVARVSAMAGELLRSHGFTLAPRDEGGVAATLPLGDGPRLLIVGHADTVWPAGTTAVWPVERRDGTLSGPGVGDMKSCLVMAAHAVSAARRAGLSGVGAIEVLIVPDEEHGSVGSRAWIEDRACGAGACLGLEAGWPGGGVVVARGAVGAVRVRAQGRTAHAAGHEDRGASAVAALAPLVGALEGLSQPLEGALVSVGVFRGGVARQVVPDEAELLVDLRAPDAATAETLLDHVGAAVAAADADAGGGARLWLEGAITRPAFPRVASDTMWALARLRARELGIPLVPVTSRGGSDASFAAALGVPTLDGLGPICHDSCARGERIEIVSLAERAALMACLLCDLWDPS